MAKISELLNPSRVEVGEILNIIDRFGRGRPLLIGDYEVWHDTREPIEQDHPDLSSDKWVVSHRNKNSSAYFDDFLDAVEYAEWKAGN